MWGVYILNSASTRSRGNRCSEKLISAAEHCPWPASIIWLTSLAIFAQSIEFVIFLLSHCLHLVVRVPV